jgi:hypothetical protein
MFRVLTFYFLLLAVALYCINVDFLSITVAVMLSVIVVLVTKEVIEC